MLRGPTSSKDCSSAATAEPYVSILRSFTGVDVQPIWDTYALTLLCTPASNESVYVEAVYDATVIPKMQLRRVMTPFLHTLTQTTQSSNQLVGDVDSMSPEDIQQHQAWNGQVPSTSSLCIHDLIQQHSVSQANAAAIAASAIAAWDGEFTYEELEDQSSRLAASLAPWSLVMQYMSCIHLARQESQNGASATNATIVGPALLLNKQSRVFQFSSGAFDLTISDYLFTLACGTNWAFLTASVARTLGPEAVPGLTMLLIGSESAKLLDTAMWTELVQLFSAYGPSEYTVHSTSHLTAHDTSSSANIGRGLAAVCWLVDPVNPDRLAPIRSVGELLIEGPIVDRGYLGRVSFIMSPSWLFPLRTGGQSTRHICIVRSGRIIGTETEGIPNADDFYGSSYKYVSKWEDTLRMICGYLWLSVADVEEVATSILTSTFSSLNQTAAPSILEVEAGIRVSHFWDIVKRDVESQTGVCDRRSLDTSCRSLSGHCK
ncbi:hypothetical protein BDV23DRAFT_185891 [Aspergillus alliaceus]|uniref:AMP-dependent synthetase/ligase domain-containing protein n=1 Tax=Petromyces alliaceus TaxID=209559 RepID=A0A5N7C1B8_PETAA|nr:hypothetical protein BDV23DRAFT_185891 [Aspergillus alliaceus]